MQGAWRSLGYVLLGLVSVPPALNAQPERTELIEITSEALEGNLIGDSADRRFAVSLPPSYHDGDRRYPVRYWLAGYGGQAGNQAWVEFVATDVLPIVDGMIEDGDAEEYITVWIDGYNRFGGSLYSSSATIGDWESYIVREVVEYVDGHYRTIAHRDGRVIDGVSMGGSGAMRLALRYPDVFCAVTSQAGPYGPDTEARRQQVLQTPRPTDWSDAGPSLNLLATLGAAVSNPDKPPFYVDWPYEIVDGEPQLVPEIWQRVVSHDVLHDVDRYLSQPIRLKAITLYHGINDNVVPVTTAWALARKLTEAGIACTYVEHNLGHWWRPEDSARSASKVLGGRVPQVESVTVSTTSMTVEAPAQLDVRLSLAGPVPASGAFPELWLDLSPVAANTGIRLGHDGSGQYVLSYTVATAGNGWFALPVTMGEEGETLLTLPLAVRPVGDAVILEDELATGWHAESKGGAAPLSLTGEGPVYRGAKAAAFQVAPASFIGWSLRLISERPVSDFGYAVLAFAFHPGDATGSVVSIVAGNVGARLLGSRTEEPIVDLDRKEWQAVELPLPTGTMTEIAFSGNVKGTFYIDDMRLIAEPAPPHIPPTAVVEERSASLPSSLTLSPSYPNPFNANTTIRFSLPQQEMINLAIHNLAGQQVTTLASGQREAGAYTLRWDGRDDDGRELASGVYLYQLEAGEQVEARKLLLLR